MAESITVIYRDTNLPGRLVTMLTLGPAYNRPLTEAHIGNSVRRKRRLFSLAIALGIVMFLVCMAVLQRDGLFNNHGVLQHALQEHVYAWRASGLTDVITPSQAAVLHRQFTSTCITEETDWKPVDLSASLEEYRRSGVDIACHHDVISRRPYRFLETYRWTVIYRPLRADSMQVIQVRRGRESL